MYVVFQTKEIQIMDELNILTECALFRGLRRAQIRERMKEKY